ncbi:terpene synthase family protein [Streptomyces iconiensis]|uniref:Terpene synthase n=1 Tax=Streptomyces iconiensis TaxID=1384038 RepID=A0ABT7A1D5_9ACTN|nr:hypothetical protein [Streptomyces iconiensis]MDJ1135152.1 hypothetical protein [Streptomyces iconiensis]
MTGETEAAATIPRLRLPFPARSNPHVRVLSEHLESWVRMSGCLPEAGLRAWREGRYAELVSRMYPMAAPPLLEPTAEAVMWLFLYDDHLDPGGPGATPEAAERLTQLVKEALSPGPVPPHPLAACVRGFRDTLVPLLPPQVWERFAAEVERFAEAMLHEVRSRASGTLPTPEVYLADRCLTAGWFILTTLAEANERAALEPAVANGSAHTELRRVSGEIACAINDLLSLDREFAGGEHHNLVMLVRHAEQCDVREAVTRVHDWLTARLSEYFAVRTRFLSQRTGPEAHASAELSLPRYVSGLESLMRGSLDWSLETGRYRPSGTWEGTS